MSSRIPWFCFRTAALPFACLLALALSLCLTPVHAAAGPSVWWMFHQNTQHTGISSVIGPSTPMQKWPKPYITGGNINSSPAISADGTTLYIGSDDGNLYAISTATGAPIWQYMTGGSIDSSPALSADGKTVYVGSADGYLYAINTATGTILAPGWKFQTNAAIYSSPVIGTYGTIYVGSEDGHLYAINTNGSVQWSALVGSASNNYPAALYSSPALSPDKSTVYIGSTDNNLYAFNTTTGAPQWTTPFLTGGQIWSSPAIGADGTIYVGSFDNNLYAINPNGTQKWVYATKGEIYSSPALSADGTTVYVGSEDNNLDAIKTATGAQLWQYTTAGPIDSSPTVGLDGTIYVGSQDNNIYALTPAGALVWKYGLPNYIESCLTLGADGAIYAGAGNSVYAVSSSLPTLYLNKTVSPLGTGPGGSVTYTLNYADYGCAATNVMLSDTLPANVAYVLGSASTVPGNNNAANFIPAAAYSVWQANTAYAVGSVVQPATPNGNFYICTVAGKSGATEPNPWPVNKGVLYIDGTVTWTILFTTWQANIPYIVGDIVAPTTPNGCFYTCTTAGTSGLTEPAWPISGTVTDGTATWTATPGTLIWPLGTLAAGNSGSVTFGVTVATVNANNQTTLGSKITNTASISCKEVPAPVTGSVSFTVFGPPTQLAFITQPSNTGAGADITPAVQVAVEDANGDIVTTATNAITLTLVIPRGDQRKPH